MSRSHRSCAAVRTSRPLKIAAEVKATMVVCRLLMRLIVLCWSELALLAKPIIELLLSK